MQLMTFNSLLMFDIVFVFFLFLVGVTCLVYYLPTGGGGVIKHHSHAQSYSQHLNEQDIGVEAVSCRYDRHSFNPCPHHRFHQVRYSPQPVETETEGTETETDSETTSCPAQDQRQIPVEDQDQEIAEHILPPFHPCRCSLSAACTACAYASNRGANCVLAVEEEDITSSSTVDLRLLERHPTPHHNYCYRHSIQANRCLHYLDEDDPDNDSSDDIFYCQEDAASGVGMASFGGLLNSVTSSISPLFEHVVVNETESGAGVLRPSAPAAPQCCYIKAKFMDLRECKGPVVDV